MLAQKLSRIRHFWNIGLFKLNLTKILLDLCICTKDQEMINNISKNIYNRVSVWNDVLGQAHSYLQIEKNLTKYNSDKENYLSYTVANRTHSVHKELTISKALVEAAIINLWQVFTTGIEGTGISNNQGNPEIDKIRTKLKSHTIKELNWTYEEFDNFYNLIKIKRNGLLAHYDGVVGNYTEHFEGLSSRMSAGVSLLETEKEKLGMLVKAMYEYVFNFLYVEKGNKK